MDRRTFLASALGTSVAGVSGGARRSGIPPQETNVTLAGLPLRQLRDRLRRELFDVVLPFFDRFVIDRDHGGFNCTLAENGTHPEETKEAAFQGRGLWVYSHLYNHFGRNAGHLEIARRTAQLLERSLPTGDDVLWSAKLTRDGRPTGPPSPTIATDVAAAEGFAEFARASGERRYRALAKQILLRCHRIYERPDYSPNVVAVYGGPTPIAFPGARSQGAAMILIGTISPMIADEPDAELDAILRQQLTAVMERHYNPAFDLNNELLNHDYSRPANALAQFVYTGHCIEALGIVLTHAMRIADRGMFDTAATRLRRHTDVAWDQVYGGFYRSLDDVDANRWELNKALWVQEEALNGLITIVEHTGAPWAADLFTKVFAYVQQNYYVERWGSRFWISGGDRTVRRAPNLSRVEHYHHPRNLMHTILALDRMLGRGGIVRP
jgi:N-acylglucosamine 2-epimerase